MFIKANGNLINADNIVKVTIDWDEVSGEGYFRFLGQDLKTIDIVHSKSKEEFDKYMKLLTDRLNYELDIVSELQEIKKIIKIYSKS